VNCACCWSKEVGTGHALICIAGRDAKIKVYKVKDASLYAVSPHMTPSSHVVVPKPLTCYRRLLLVTAGYVSLRCLSWTKGSH
jgi:hypothetical protein